MKNSYINLKILIEHLYYFLPLAIGFGAFLPNLFIVLISVIFLTLVIKKIINIELIPNVFFKFLIIFWVISLLSSLFSVNKLISLQSSFFYIRFIIFLYATKWLLDNNMINYKKFFKIIIWSLTFVLFFAYLEYFTGYNIITQNILDFLEMGPIQHSTRISGLFGDEQVLGGYLLRILLFSLIIFSFVENIINEKMRYYFLFLMISCGVFIVLSGERSAIFLFLLFILSSFILINGFRKIKIFLPIILILIWSSLILSKPDLYNRIVQQTFQLQLYSAEDDRFYFFSKIHEAHYKTAINIFYDKPIIGAGNKSFRYLCDREKYSSEIIKFETGDLHGKSMGCATHPHNYYIQILSENGIFNLIIICTLYLMIIRKLFVHFFSKYFKNKQILENRQIFILLFFAILLWPIIPTGSFFSSWISSTLFLPIAYLAKEFNK